MPPDFYFQFDYPFAKRSAKAQHALNESTIQPP